MDDTPVFMSFKDSIMRLRWPWLIVAPIAIMFIASAQVGIYACTAETQTLVQPEEDAGLLCRVLVDEQRIGRVSSNVSPTEVASMRIAVVAFLVAAIYGLIALLVGYKVFLPEAGSRSVVDCFGCSLNLDATTHEVSGRVAVSTLDACVIEDLIVEDGTGRVLQRYPSLGLDAAEVHRWQILPPHSSLPTKLVVKGRVVAAGTHSSRFLIEFDLMNGCRPIRAVRDWP